MQPPALRRILITAVALLCVLQSVAGIGVAVGVDVDESTQPTAGAVEAVAQQTTPTNNTSVQQEDPDSVDESGDSDAVRAYLAQQLAERLGESTTQISQGQYEQGQLLVGDQYDELLDQYVTVDGGAGDGQTAESFQQTSESQREYGSAVQAYNETYQQYSAAKQAGNSIRARELARELDQISDQVNRTGQNLTQSYTRVENTTGVSLANATANVENTTREIQEQQGEIVSATFVQTTLTATINASTVSFDHPATIRGHLRRENGTPVDTRAIEIRLGGQTSTVRTDNDGRFSLPYRPVRVPRDVESTEIAYLPAESSAYLGANASVDVDITQVSADLTVSTNTTTMQFGDHVAVTGQANVNGTPVPDARVRIRLGGRTIGTAVTNAEGMYRLTESLTGSVPSGDTAVEAVIVPADAAVRSDAVTTSVQVDSTPTALSVNATQLPDSQLQLSGELRTAAGRPLDNQVVELRVAGSTVATVETRRDGTFQRAVTVREGLTGPVTVRAVYDEPSTNLGQASAQTSVTLDAGGDGSGGDGSGGESETPLPVSIELLGGGGVVLLSVLVIGWLIRHEEGGTESGAAGSPAKSSTDLHSKRRGESGIVEHASSRLASGDADAAIRALYAAVRNSIGTADSEQTHWEFYTAASDHLDPETVGTLERLTEAYEQVVYSTDSVEESMVEQLLDESEQLTDGHSTEMEPHDAD